MEKINVDVSQDTVSFQNDGLIDRRCITTMGVSIKETENPIGFFGTGLKYAIAIILRNGGEITIWRGTEPLKFAIHDAIIRDQPVQIITMNGVELAFTTSLGKHWGTWQAFRELWCNTKDEGGKVIGDVLEPQKGKTTIHVTLPEFVGCLNNIDDYILTDWKPVYKDGICEFHSRQTRSTFYRGINVGTIHNVPYFFTPNILSYLVLTEDRTYKSAYDVQLAIAGSILTCEDTVFLSQWLTTTEAFAEFHVDLDWSHITPGKTFLDVVGNILQRSEYTLNKTAITVYGRYKPLLPTKIVVLTDIEIRVLKRALDFCDELGYTANQFEVAVVDSLEWNALGRALPLEGKIEIARSALTAEQTRLCAVLIEQWAILKYGFKSCDRSMQDWLLDQLVVVNRSFIQVHGHSISK